ncbi:phage tail spike protein [Streptococcus suis]|uniref:phage tail spike protein n=1 Tax=Streptococcus suis TaxID=1307 RepID=UPI0005CD00CC|nr:phage tail spike protein [Streptococcus suis]NQG82906.1 hypothetical protein [Streptococcus suis]QBX30681.1 hyaluronidase [Streptococcus phage Javan566]CYV68002.1 phage minor structural protein [Streptococcus suis]
MIYLKDGNIPLNLAYDDDIVQEANSTYQLSFKFPLTDGKWNLLRREVFLLADDLHGEQEFFIFEVKKAKGHVQVYAKQVATLLNYYSINSISVDRVPGQTVMTALAGSVKRPCPFTFFSDILDRHTFNESNVSVMAALAKDKHSIVGQWGGDLVRDKYQVKLLKNGGIENESLFMYKKNLSSYEESENINNLKTRLHLKKTIKGQSEGEADRVIAVTVDSPLIGQYRQIYEADIEVNDQDVTDVASLTAYGKRYFSSTLCDLVENSINLDVKGKSDVSVKMFDMVSVFHERFDVDLRLKISSYHFGPMSKRLKSIGFGKVSQSFGSTVASMVAGSVDKATGRLSASFEQKLQKEIDNANRHFDAEFDKRVESINDGIEQAQAEAERYADAIKQEIDTEIAQVNQSMQAQSEEHDRQVADILSKTQSVESLANQAKSGAASALARANQVKTEAIADARAQVATVSQALNTAKSELQTAIASADQKARDSQASATALRNDLNLQASKILEQARAQTALTSRVTTVETLADGTRSTVAELSKTVSKATGDITSVTSRTKTVEDTLSQTRTQYEALTQTVNMQTGQIDSINRKTADLQSGIDGVTERFESLRIEDNLLLNSSFNQNLNQWRGTGVTIVDGKARITGELNKTKYIYQSIKSQTANDDVSQVYIASISVKVSNYVDGRRNPYLALYISGIKNDSAKTWFGATYLTPSRLEAVNNKGIVQFTTTFKVNVPRSQIDRIDFHIYARDFTGEVEFEKVSLRRGNIDLGWQASPEDLRSEIASYKRTADEASAELSRQIQTVDGKAVDAKTYAQQTATAINTRLESLETYKNEEGTRANQYLTASRTETAKQLSAERTAIATNYVAKSTYDENVRGTTLKLNDIKTTADTAKQNLATYQNTVDRKLTELISTTQTLDGKINTASAKITQNANEISKRLTSTQVDKAITDKGYQTKSDVDNNITGRGYITNSALQPYALATTVQNLVRETADSFSRTISETKALIPTEVGGRNYLLNSKTEISGGWSSKVISLSPELLNNLNKIKSVTISCDVEGTNVATKNSRKRYGLACSVEINGIVNYWEVWQTQDTTKKRISQTFSVPEGKVITKFYSPTLWIQAEGSVKVSNPKLEFGVLSTDWSPAPEDLATVTALHAVNDTVDSHTRTIGAVGEAGSILDNVSKVTQTAQGLVQEVSGTNGLKTQVSTLAGSYAIKNLTKAGDVLGQINLNSDGSVRINEGLISVGTKTYIQDGVITSAKIAGLDAGKITSGYLASGRIKAGSIDGSKIAFDEAFFNGLVANQAYLKKLFAKDAFLTAVQAVAVSAKQITGGIAEALNGGMDVNFDESKINFYTNVAAIRRIYTGHPTQFIKFETEGNYSRTIIGSNRNGGEVFNSATFAGIVVENTNNINTEDNVRIYGDNTLLRHAQGDVGWNINSVTQRIVPANMNAESEIWSKHFVAPDKNSKPVRLDTAVAALWDIWNHIIYNNFEFNAALRTHIKARRDNWKFELNL